MPINRRMDKEDVVHIYTIEYSSAIKKNEILSFATTWVGLEIIILSEVSQTEKEKYHILSLTCRILKKMIHMNLFAKQKQTHRFRE